MRFTLALNRVTQGAVRFTWCHVGIALLHKCCAFEQVTQLAMKLQSFVHSRGQFMFLLIFHVNLFFMIRSKFITGTARCCRGRAKLNTGVLGVAKCKF